MQAEGKEVAQVRNVAPVQNARRVNVHSAVENSYRGVDHMDLTEAILQAIQTATAPKASETAREEVYTLKERARVAADDGDFNVELRCYARIGEICCGYLFNDSKHAWNPANEHLMALTATCERCALQASETMIDGASLARRSMLEIAYILREHSDRGTRWRSLLTDKESLRVSDQLQKVVRWNDDQEVELSTEAREMMTEIQKQLTARIKGT